MKLIKQHTNSAFTIVELLVVIVVIGILAAISIVAYTAVSQKAISASLQSDLSTAAKRIKLFQVENSAYPESLINCPTPNVKNLCIKLSSGNSYVGYAFNNSSNPQTYLLIAGNGKVNYKISNNTQLAQLDPTAMQPGVTPGAALELHAAKANNGTGPGINSPLTTQWWDKSGNGNHGTLTGFGGETPWIGAGTAADPYRLVFDGANDKVAATVNGLSAHASTAEVWTSFTTAGPASYPDCVLQIGDQTLISRSDSGNGGVMIWTWNAGWSDARAVRAGSVNNGLMHHVVAVFGTQWMELYVDGIYIGHTDILTGFTMPAFGSIAMAQAWWGLFDGKVSVARIYPFALSATQVSANYSRGTSW